MKIDLNDEQMRGVILEAVMKTLNEDTRTTIIAAAIDHLLRPEKSYGGKSESPLQGAFNRAIETVAEQTAREEIEHNDVVKQKLRELLHSAIDRLLENRAESITRIAAALEKAMTQCDSY